MRPGWYSAIRPGQPTVNFYYRNNKPRLASPGHFNVEGKPQVDFIEQSDFKFWDIGRYLLHGILVHGILVT